MLAERNPAPVHRSNNAGAPGTRPFAAAAGPSPANRARISRSHPIQQQLHPAPRSMPGVSRSWPDTPKLNTTSPESAAPEAAAALRVITDILPQERRSPC